MCAGSERRALGFWSVLSKMYPKIGVRRCWMHKMGNVLTCLPKSGRMKAKEGLHEIWRVEIRTLAERAFGYWFGALSGQVSESGRPPDAEPG